MHNSSGLQRRTQSTTRVLRPVSAFAATQISVFCQASPVGDEIPASGNLHVSAPGIFDATKADAETAAKVAAGTASDPAAEANPADPQAKSVDSITKAANTSMQKAVKKAADTKEQHSKATDEAVDNAMERVIAEVGTSS